MLNLQKYRDIFGCISKYKFFTATKCTSNHASNRLSSKFCLNYRQMKTFHSEYNAIVKLIARSNIPQTKLSLMNSKKRFVAGASSLDLIRRHLHSSCALNKDLKKKNESDRNGNESVKKKSSSEPSSGNNNNNKDDDDEKMMSLITKGILWMLSVYLFVVLLSIVFPSAAPHPDEDLSRYVSWNEFVHHMLAVGEVKELIIRPDMEIVTVILHEEAVVKGRKANSTIFHMAVADTSKFEEKLRNEEKRLGIKEVIPITYDRNSDVTGRILILLLIFALLMTFLSRMRGMKGPIGRDSLTQMGRAKFTLVDPFEGGKGVLFSDVAGLQEAKQEVMEFVDYLKTPEKYQKLGAKVPRGALLLGPPGCGKTLLAKAVATEAQVPFLSMNGSEFIEMIGGLGAARVRDLFGEAKKRAPCIIYIDEIDAIGRQRSGVGNSSQMSSGESEQTLNQLLVEMDGMSSKEGVLMLASTNRADILDKALLRPGRFDRHILIDLPNLQERREIFEKHLSSIQLSHEPKHFSDRLARLTPGFSGADIANVCNEAALHAARNVQKHVTAKNLEYAVERLVGGTEKRSHALSATERKVIAYHESGHALVGWLLPYSDVLLKVTIVPRTSLALGFAQYTPSEQKLFTKEELFDKMCMALGGRAAENIIFNRITTGAQNDLEKVTKIAYAQVKKFGMNDAIGPVYINDNDESDGGSMMTEKPYSKALESLCDQQVRNLVTRAYERTEEILNENKNKLVKLAEALLEKETLQYKEVVELIGDPVGKSRKYIEPHEFEETLKSLSSNDKKM